MRAGWSCPIGLNSKGEKSEYWPLRGFVGSDSFRLAERNAAADGGRDVGLAEFTFASAAVAVELVVHLITRHLFFPCPGLTGPGYATFLPSTSSLFRPVLRSGYEAAALRIDNRCDAEGEYNENLD
jgi:hypothetical protein